LWPQQFELDRWFRGRVQLDVRKFLLTGLGFLFMGIVSAICVAFDSSNGKDTRLVTALTGAVSLLWAFWGLVLAIYSIKGILDRPTRVEDVLDRLASIIHRVNKEERRNGRGQREQGFLLLMGEYPAIGALTCFHDKTVGATNKQLGDWDGWLRNQYHKELLEKYDEFQFKLWRVTIVCPCDNSDVGDQALKMDEIISDYGKRNGFKQKDIEAAQNFNRGLIEHRFKTLPNGRFKWLAPAEAEKMPRYQIIVCGTYDNHDNHFRLIAKEALVFLALDSPASLFPSTAKKKQGHSDQPLEEEQARGQSKEVPIIAWQITDRLTLESLVTAILKVVGKSNAKESLI
jgi:hypothetical protein